MNRRWLLFSVVVAWFFFWPQLASAEQSYTIEGPYKPQDGLTAFRERTGLKVYRPENSFEIGWCTWFVAAVLPEPVPMKSGAGENDAAKWTRNFQDAGFTLSQAPEVGSIVVWNSSIGRGHGHVAYVTKVFSKDKFEVWDSNWSISFDRQVRRRMIYKSSEPAIAAFILPKIALSPEEKPLTFLADRIAAVLVIDKSGSMKEQGKFERASAGVDSLIDVFLTFDYLSLVGFGDQGKALAPLTSMQTPNARAELKAEKGGIGPNEWTNIPGGLDVAFGQLQHAPVDLRRAVILLSDGISNRGDLKAAVDRFVRAGIPIFTIGYGRNADRPTLANIAQRTGGSFLNADTSNITQAYQKLAAQARLGSVIVAYNDSLEQGGRLSYLVGIAQDFVSAVFVCDWQGSRVGMKLIPPSGAEITSQNWRDKAGVRYVEAATYSLFLVDRPQEGSWRVDLSGEEIPGKEQVNLSVSGRSPLYANSLMSSPYYRRGERITLLVRVAEVSGGTLIRPTQISVTASVTKPEPNAIGLNERGKIGINWHGLLDQAISGKDDLTLYDDGRPEHGDQQAADGIFSAIYGSADRDGPYAVEIRCRITTAQGDRLERTMRESLQVGEINANKFTLSRLLGL